MRLLRTLSLTASLLLPVAALAQDAGDLSIELNAADTVGESCRLTFVLSNGLEKNIDKLVAETVLFSDKGGVLLLTLFDFATLPAGRPRVRQFQVPETSCDRLGQVLINGVDTCTIDSTQSGVCQAALTLSSRVKIGLGG